MEIEIWRDIPDYEGLYQVSNFGNVKSLPRNGTKGGILKPRKNCWGYLQVVLWSNGNSSTLVIHRLVASVFIPNPNNLQQVNHKDENKENNHVDNLEWVTPKENCNHATRNERISKKLKGRKLSEEHKKKMSETRKGKYKGENNPMYGKHLLEETKQKISITKKGKPNYQKRKPILQFTLDSVFIREWDSAIIASKELNLSQGNITACCQGKRNKCGDFIWKYKENNSDLVVS